MVPVWKTNFGQLIIGGCGTQVGLLLTFSTLAVVLLFCGVCAFANVLSLSVAQQLAPPPPEPVVAAEAARPADDEAVGLLLAQVNFLLGELEALETGAPKAILAPAAPVAPPAGPPMVTANQGEAMLYSSPDPGGTPVSRLPAGQSLEIVGRDSSSTWWLVALPDGDFVWVSANGVAVLNMTDAVPVVTTPSQLAQPAASGPAAGGAIPTPGLPPTPTPPLGTPTPGADVERQFVENTASYDRMRYSLLVPPVSASFSPDGNQIALSEQIKLYIIQTLGSYPEIPLEENNDLRPLGAAVWSPDGRYIASVIESKQPDCLKCRSVVLLRVADGEITYLNGPDGLQTDAPRWTQDGRVLLNAHSGEPADGTAYVYNVFGEGREAAGIYLLSSSHDGQKWFPWLPGRTWRASVSERPDSYYND